MKQLSGECGYIVANLGAENSDIEAICAWVIVVPEGKVGLETFYYLAQCILSMSYIPSI